MTRKILAISAAVAATALVAVSAAFAASPLANPGFETGDLSGWNNDSWGAGGWAASSTGASGCDNPATLAPWEGSYSAMWDMEGPSGGLLWQDFTVPASETIGFAFAYNNAAEGWTQDEIDPYELDEDNQWLRIDVIESSADPDTLDPGDIVATAFDSQAGSPAFAQDWQNVSLSLPGRASDTLTLRVATVNTEYCMPVWLDAVGNKAQVNRTGYCSVAGNTNLDGVAIKPGTFLDLADGQPASDPHYKGATPSFYYQGLGLSCDSLPGYTKTGELVGYGGKGDPGTYTYMAKN